MIEIQNTREGSVTAYKNTIITDGLPVPDVYFSEIIVLGQNVAISSSGHVWDNAVRQIDKLPALSGDELIVNLVPSARLLLQKQSQNIRNQDAIKLLNTWLNDTTDYDEKVWPVVKSAIEKNKLSARKKFDD